MKPKNLALISLILILLTVLNAFSQIGIYLPVLLESPDGRYSGMGETGTGIANDIYATYKNPAGLGFLKQTLIPEGFIDNSIGDSINYLEGTISSAILPQYVNSPYSYLTLAFGIFLEPLNGTLILDFNYEGLGEFTRTSENGTVLGKYNPNDYSIGLAYGISVGNDWALGAKLKYIQSNLVPKSDNITSYVKDIRGSSYSFDIGALWKPQNLNLLGIRLGNKFSLGANLKNIGPGISYNNNSNPLPTQLCLGTAFNLIRNEISDLIIAVDFSKLLVNTNQIMTINGSDTTYAYNSDGLPKSIITGWKNSGFEFGIGAEYWFIHHVAVRTGYYTEPEILGNRNYMTLGGSLRFHIFQADISYNLASGPTKYLDIMKITIRAGGN